MNYTQNEKIEQVTDSTMVVGVDIGSQIHYARAFDNRGRELTKRIFSFHNNLEGFNSFNLWAETLKTENKKTAVLIRDLVYSRDRIIKQHNISANRIQRWLAIHFPETLVEAAHNSVGLDGGIGTKSELYMLFRFPARFIFTENRRQVPSGHLLI